MMLILVYQLHGKIEFKIIQQHWEFIPVFSDDSLDEEVAKQLDKVLLDSHYSAPDLSCLSEPLRRLLVEHDGYDFTRSNLLCAINDLQGTFAKHEMLALNQIRSISTPVYQYVIKNVDKYLDFLKESEYALDFVDGTVASIQILLQCWATPSTRYLTLANQKINGWSLSKLLAE